MDSVVVVLDSDADSFVPTVAGTSTSAVAKLVTSCEPFVAMVVEPVGTIHGLGIGSTVTVPI